MQCFEAEGTFGSVAFFSEAEFFSEVFEDIDCGEARHFSADKLGGEVARMNAPVSMSEVLEEEFIEWFTVKFDQGAFRVFTFGMV